MGDIYALMVGIDNYRDPSLRRLRGCRQDVLDAIAFFDERRQPGTEVNIRELFDDKATGQAIVDGFRGHLSRAGVGDTALFWFSGHGSTDPVPEAFWHLEKGGRLQTLVCADSRVDGRPELLDKELALLLDEVAESGCHVVVVLDCCHAGGATRAVVEIRSADPADRAPASRLLPDMIDRYAAGPPKVRYVLLAACQADEEAGEDLLDGSIRGRFSWALIQALHRAGPSTTYRDLVVLARNEVERQSATQRPVLFPDGPGLADQQLLGGLTTDPPTIMMTYGRDGWEVNAGAAYGVEAHRTRFAVDEPAPARQIDPIEVGVGRSRVEPIGWTPDPASVYRVLIERPAKPTLFGLAGQLEHPRVDDPFVRFVDVEDAELIISPVPGGVRLTSGDGEEIADLGAGLTAADLRHIARWWRVRTLRNEDSRIAYGVLLEVVQPLPGEVIIPRQRPAERIGADRTLRLAYRVRNGRPEAPSRFLRLRNTTNRPLYCVLLNLTQRFKINGELFWSGKIEAGGTAAAHEGGPVYFCLPEDIEDVPGTSYRDWLLLIVSTEPIDALPYEMAELTDTRRDTAPTRRRTPVPGDWWTSVLKVVTAGPR